MNRRWWLGIVATAALAASVSAVACGGAGDSPGANERTGSSPRLGDVASPADTATDAGKATGASASPPTSAGGAADDGGAPALPSTIDRKVISNTALGLQVADVGAAFDEAGRLARVNGGYTEKSSFDAGSSTVAKATSATLTLRVPVANYDALLDALRAMPGAKLASQSASSTEITEQYTDLQSRLRNLERTEQSYLTLLEQAKSIQDILTVNDRLDSVRGQIEQIQGRLNLYDNLADLATVEVTIALPPPAQPVSGGDGPKSLSAAFSDAWAWSLDGARYAAAGGAVVVVGLVWLAVPLLLLALAAIAVRRRGAAPRVAP